MVACWLDQGPELASRIGLGQSDLWKDDGGGRVSFRPATGLRSALVACGKAYAFCSLHCVRCIRFFANVLIGKVMNFRWVCVLLGHSPGKFYGQAKRAISNGKLHTLLHFHTRPINVVVFHGPSGRSYLGEGFALICIQRLSRPNFATQPCTWRYNWITRGSFTSVLSY